MCIYLFISYIYIASNISIIAIFTPLDKTY